MCTQLLSYHYAFSKIKSVNQAKLTIRHRFCVIEV
jgi:hypothetical protein